MALPFANIHGQPGVLAELRRSFQAGSVVHAFLIHGDAGCGKKTLATTLSMALHCEGEGEKPCMVCGPCQRMLKGTHPDHVELATEKATLTVKEIRDLIDSLTDKPYEGGKRTVIIHEAEKMNEAAQNAFLKTLEEPDGQTVFFLLTAHPEGLLQTVRSRCRPVYMPRLPEEVILGELEARGIERERARYAASLSQGVLGRAIELSGEDPYYAYRDEAVRMLLALKSKEDMPKVSMAWEEKRKPEDSLPFLDALEAVLRDVLRAINGLEPFDAALADPLEDIARHFTSDAIACIMEEAVTVRKRVSAHVQWRSAAEPLLLKIVEGAKI
jgi:DNA polymerase-3 subunit delta'